MIMMIVIWMITMMMISIIMTMMIIIIVIIQHCWSEQGTQRPSDSRPLCRRSPIDDVSQGSAATKPTIIWWFWGYWYWSFIEPWCRVTKTFRHIYNHCSRGSLKYEFSQQKKNYIRAALILHSLFSKFHQNSRNSPTFARSCWSWYQIDENTKFSYLCSTQCVRTVRMFLMLLFLYIWCIISWIN